MKANNRPYQMSDFIENDSFFVYDTGAFNHAAGQNGLGDKLYAEKIYAGNETIWGIYEKKFTLSSKAEDQTATYLDYNEYYLEKENTFYEIDSENKLVTLLKDHKSELKKFISKNSYSKL